MGGCVQIIPRISPMLGMHIVRVVVIDANHTYAHTKGPSEGIENKTSASFKYAMTFSCQDKRGLVPTRPKPLSMILLVLDELKLCLQPMCSGVKKMFGSILTFDFSQDILFYLRCFSFAHTYILKRKEKLDQTIIKK